MNLIRTNPVLLLLAAFVLGVAGDQLLRVYPWGVNLALWVSMAAAVTASLARGSGNALGPQRLLMLAASVLFASCLAWRAAPELAVLSIMAAFASALLAVMPRSVADLRRTHIVQIVSGSLLTLFDAAVGVVPLIAHDIIAGLGSSLGSLKRVYLVARGALLALPLVLIVGSLFVSADATFQHLVEEVLYIDIVRLLDHMLLIGALAWPLAGVLRGHILAGHRVPPQGIRPQGLWLQYAEVGIILGSLSLLSAVFIGTQFLYLFGGSAYVLGAPSLTLAEYARRGFFELVAVVTVVVPVLLAADWLLCKNAQRDVRRFRLLAGFQIAMLFTLMVSALHRLLIYQQEFGLTRLRIYAVAALVWLGIVLVWFIITVLRGRREHFAAGMLAAAGIVIAGLHLVNPDGLVGRVNLERHRSGKVLDAAYLVALGADAVPALLEGYDLIPMPERGRLAAMMLRMHSQMAEQGVLSWNRARAKADAEIAPRLEVLRRDAEALCHHTPGTAGGGGDDRANGDR